MSELQVDFSNLNVTRGSLLRADGDQFYDFLKEAGYDGAEVTVLRPLFLRRMLGRHAQIITNGLEAPFAGRTFPEVGRDTLRHPSLRNVRGLGYTAIMREVERSLPQMVALQESLGKGALQAVLYPQSGDKPHSLDYSQDNAPFERRSFQLTAEVLYRWGIDLTRITQPDDLIELTRHAMEEHGFNGITISGRNSRRAYEVNTPEGPQSVSLPPDFIPTLIKAGMVTNFYLTTGKAGGGRQQSDDLVSTLQKEGQLLRQDADRFAETEQGTWLRAAWGRYKGSGNFRVITRQPETVRLTGKHRQDDLADHQQIVQNLHLLSQIE